MPCSCRRKNDYRVEEERIRSRAWQKKKKNKYQKHIETTVIREHIGGPTQNSIVEYKNGRRFGIENWCTRTLRWC